MKAQNAERLALTHPTSAPHLRRVTANLVTVAIEPWDNPEVVVVVVQTALVVALVNAEWHLKPMAVSEKQEVTNSTAQVERQAVTTTLMWHPKPMSVSENEDVTKSTAVVETTMVHVVAATVVRQQEPVAVGENEDATNWVATKTVTQMVVATVVRQQEPVAVGENEDVANRVAATTVTEVVVATVVRQQEPVAVGQNGGVAIYEAQQDILIRVIAVARLAIVPSWALTVTNQRSDLGSNSTPIPDSPRHRDARVQTLAVGPGKTTIAIRVLGRGLWWTGWPPPTPIVAWRS